MSQTRTTEVEIQWRAAPLTMTIATCAATALAAGVIGGRWQLIAFAAPLLGVLCSIGWQRQASAIHVHGTPTMTRCFETEEVEATVWVTAESPDTAVTLQLSPIEGMHLQRRDGGSDELAEVAVSADRWGRYPVRAQVQAFARGGLMAGTATVDAVDVFVFPLAPPQSTEIPLTDLPDRLGAHLTRHVGPGVEYADIRPYLPGDQLRTVNWAVSARRGALHVTERLTDRAADVVVLIDNSVQAPGPASAAAERAATGATHVVQTALRLGDRAGIVTLGGNRPRWLGTDIGRRQFYRILDAMLGAGSDFETTTGTLAPRAAVPPGSIIVAFSTLLDTQFALALIELSRRGHTVIAVDVLDRHPFDQETDPIVVRMWALQRSAMYRDMGTVGVDVIAWPDDATLDQAMRLVPANGRRAHGRKRP